MNKIFTAVIMCLVIVYVAEAGIRCSIGVDFACSLSCKVLGQSGGTCDNEDECW